MISAGGLKSSQFPKHSPFASFPFSLGLFSVYAISGILVDVSDEVGWGLEGYAHPGAQGPPRSSRFLQHICLWVLLNLK